MSEPFRVCFVCSGNICRSPMAEVVMRAKLHDAGLDGRVEVDSSGTGGWHVGDPADPRAVTALSNSGYDGRGHRVRAFEPAWFATRDLVVALDRGHERELQSWATTAEDRDKVRLLRSFGRDDNTDNRDNKGKHLDVADPYFGDDKGFTTVLQQIEAACDGLVDEIRQRLDGTS
jgi:protein-tyrosine phosphatase